MKFVTTKEPKAEGKLGAYRISIFENRYPGNAKLNETETGYMHVSTNASTREKDLVDAFEKIIDGIKKGDIQL